MRYSPEQTERDWQQYVADRMQRDLSWKLELAHDNFEKLLNKAQRAGDNAMRECAEGNGFCFVLIRFPDGLFARWLVKTGKAKVDADFDGKQAAVRIHIARRDIRDCARLEAYAEAFVRVLVAAGIDAYDESKID
jgi:hypothetical protein